jgi:tetratricopeptide (TPR) repeat protein
MVRRALVGLALAACLALAGRASAQDDWDLDRHRSPRPSHPSHPRSPRTPRAPRTTPATPPRDRLIERYRQIVEHDPSESFALARWVTLVRERDGSTTALEAELAHAMDDRTLLWPRLALAYVRREAGATAEAVRIYREASELFPSEPAPVVELARALRTSGDAAGARPVLEHARALASGDAADAIARDLVDLMIELGAVADARHLDAELAGPHASVDRRLELPRALAGRGLHDEVLVSLDEVARHVAGDPRARVPVGLLRARSELALGRTDAALTTLSSVLAVASGGLRTEAYDVAYEAYRAADRIDELVARLARERSPEAAVLLARVEDERGHDDAALAAYDRAVRLHPRDAVLQERRSQVLLRAGRVDDAVAALRALYRAAPSEPRYLLELAGLLRDDGQTTEATQALVAASHARGTDVRLHQALAELFARWGDDAHALEEVRTLVRIEPAETSHRVLLGDLLLSSGDRVGALATWHALIEGRTSSAAAHAELGAVLMDHDLLDEARVELEEAARLAPDDPEVLGRLVDVLVRAGHDADAEPIVARLAAGATTDRLRRREMRDRQVALWVRRRTLDSHVRELEQRFAASPPDIEAGHTLAEALRRAGQLQRAADVLARLVALDGTDVDALTALERVRSLSGDLAGAIDTLELLVARDPPRATSYLARMSEHALALYRDEDAVRYAERAVALAPDDAASHRRLGDLFQRRQDPEGASQHYRRALALDPRLHDVAMQLAALRILLADPAGADALYASVIADAPDDDLVERAARSSIELSMSRGNAMPLLDRLLPLALSRFDRPVYGRAALDVLDAMAAGLVPRALGSGGEARDARAALHDLASRGLPVLLRALSSSDPRERVTALAILGPSRVEAAAPALLSLVESSADAPLRRQALEAAAEVAPASLVPRLAVLARGSDAGTARLATWAIARIGGASSRPVLAELLARPDADVATLAALGLARIGDSRDAAAIARTLARAEVAPLRAGLALALSALGEEVAPATLTELSHAGGAPFVVASLVAGPAELLTSSDPASARASASVLGHVPSDLRHAWPLPGPTETALALALRAIESAPEHPLAPEVAPRVRASIATALAGPAPLATLRALEVREGRLVLAACRTSPTCTELLVGAHEILAALPVASADLVIRLEVARILGGVLDERTDAGAAALLSDAAPEVVEVTVRALARRETVSEGLAARLGEILREGPDWTLRLAAAEALRRTPVGGEEALAEALAGDAYAFVREAAARALRGRAQGQALDALATACRLDPEPRVREAACGP